MMPLDGGKVDRAAFSDFVPTSLGGTKASFTFNPSGAINGAAIKPRPIRANSIVLTGGEQTGGPPRFAPSPLFDAIRVIRTHVKHAVGAIPNHALGTVPPQSIPTAATFRSVSQFYAQDGHGSMLAAPPDNNALTGVRTR